MPGRQQGYLDGLSENNFDINPDYLVHCDLNPESATEATRKLLSLPNAPDAIFGINDTVAFAAMKEIRRQGLQITEDVGIVGFTDDYHATVVYPSLTSVTHPTFKMGETVAKLFFETLEGGSPPRQLELKTKMVIRQALVP